MNAQYINGLATNTVTFIVQALLNWPDELPLDMTFAETDEKGLGCDELDCVEIMMAIEYAMNITIDDSLFLDVDKKGNQIVKKSLSLQVVIDYCKERITECLNS